MLKKRANSSILWNYFTKNSDNSMKATCNACGDQLSYFSTTGNLNQHLKRKHPPIFAKKTKEQNGDGDDESISSIKFSSEIWSYFETEGEAARCSLCQAAAPNTVEDMRTHLEEDHPGHMIGILNKKKKDNDTDASDEERAEPIEEDIFTEVLYLDEEKPKSKRPKPRRISEHRPRTSDFKPRTESKQDTPKIQYIIEKPDRPEIDSFLNYVSVLLQNVPRETIPKLQLDIISLILNAQISRTAPVAAVIPVSNATMIPVTNSDLIGNVPNASYHITIENKDGVNSDA